MILFDLFWTFFKIGAVTFGGGLAMLRIAQEQVLAALTEFFDRYVGK